MIQRSGRVCAFLVSLMIFWLPGCVPVDGNSSDDDSSVGDDDTDPGGTFVPTPTATPTDVDADGFLAPEDCDDHNADVYPGAPEFCDHVDNNCDLAIDEALETATYYADADGDLFGDPLASVLDCDLPLGYVSDATDCDDSRADVYPGAVEVCDSVDQNCDTVIDDGVLVRHYVDDDGDGFGVTQSDAPVGCPPASDSGLSLYPGDCDDTDTSIHPMLVSQATGSSTGDGSMVTPFLTIQQGVDSPGPCRNVVVDSGIYNESLDMSGATNLELQSARGPASTVIQSTGGDRAILLYDASGVKIAGLTVTAKDAVDDSGAGIHIQESADILLEGLVVQNSKTVGFQLQGGGVYVFRCTGVTLSGCLLTGNSATYGGGLAINASTATLVDSRVEDNAADTSGGGIAIGDTSKSMTASLDIESSTIRKNRAESDGGGVWAEFTHVVTAEDSVFDSNLSKNAAGGAIYNPRTISRCHFILNTANEGGAMHVRSVANVTNSIFWRNSADGTGGAVSIDDSTNVDSFVYFINNTFLDNAGVGNAFYIYDADLIMLRNNIMIDTKSNGVVIYNLEVKAELTIDYNDIYSLNGSGIGGLILTDNNTIGKNGNIGKDAKFVSSSSSTYSSVDLHLNSSSPCIDKGNPSVGTDADSSAPDMGAYGGPSPML